jgi:predicted GNAT family acetyltransferase
MNWNMTISDFEFNMQLEPGGCFLLEVDSEPVGLATCISFGKVGWFGNLVVNEKYRKQGAGTQLVQHAVNYLKSRGAKTVGLYAYPQLTNFYGAIGFESEADFAVLKAGAVFPLGGAKGSIKAIETLDLAKIINFDEEFFGASRKKLLDLVFRNPSNIGYVVLEGSKTAGFVFSKVFGDAAEVGPLACLRDEPETAENLLGAVLRRLEGLEAYMYLPTSESALWGIASKTGFKEEFRLKRMFFGPALAKNCIYLAESLERG